MLVWVVVAVLLAVIIAVAIIMLRRNRSSMAVSNHAPIAAGAADVAPMTDLEAALDQVMRQKREVADMLAAYGNSDLLCYRADYPEALVARQAMQWDPILDWAEAALEARLHPTTGVMHSPQDPMVLARLSRRVHAMSAFELAGFHDLVSLSGSLILGFAAAHDLCVPKEVWDISRLDEIWQAEEWGKDDEAEAAAAVKEQAFIHAKQVFDLSHA